MNSSWRSSHGRPRPAAQSATDAPAIVTAALAALAGIAPIAVASADRRGHRVNHGGNRQLNRVFHVIALSQLRCEPRAKAYYEKKRAEGKTARAALRCLKRRLVDVVYRLLRAATAAPVAAAA